MSRRELGARARLDEAQSLLRQAEREMMPRQIIEFLRGKAMEIEREVERETITGVPVPGELIAPGVREATAVDVKDMDRYIRARRAGFGSRTSPVPPKMSPEDAEAVFNQRMKNIYTSSLRDGNAFAEVASRELEEAKKRLDRDVAAALLGGLPPSPAPTAKMQVAVVTTKRRITLDG